MAMQVGQALLALVLVYAGLSKVFRPNQLASVVRSYEILPKKVASAVGYVLPSVELGVGGGLLFSSSARAASGAAAALLILFSLGIAVNLARGRTDLSCGCFGVSDNDRVGPATLVRNGLLIAISLLVLLIRPSEVADSRVLPLETWIIAAALLITVAIILQLRRLIVNPIQESEGYVANYEA